MPTPARRKNPRMSVNSLAEYMVSPESTRHNIIKRSREPEEVRTTRYRNARRAVCAYLVDPMRSASHIATAVTAFNQQAADPALSSWQHNVAEQSTEIVHAVQGMSNEVGRYNFVKASGRSHIMLICGVEVSVRLDLLVHDNSKGKDQIGAAVLKMNKDATTPVTLQRRKDAGGYAAALIWLYVSQHLHTNRIPVNRLCMSIDVRHGKAFIAPPRNSRRIKDIEAACTAIAALWDVV